MVVMGMENCKGRGKRKEGKKGGKKVDEQKRI